MTAHDWRAVRRVIEDAFMRSAYGYNGEAELMELLQEKCDDVTSLVATQSDEVVGHLLFSPATIRTTNSELQGMALGPLAIAPARQSTGIGTTLVTFGLEQLAADGFPFVVVLGHPGYYLRFGFERAARYGVSHALAGIGQDAFFIKILDPQAVESIVHGTVFYRSEFGPQHEPTC